MDRLLTQRGKSLSEQPLDLTRERFVVYAPAHAPPGGYGVLAFVPPWDEAQMPLGWGPVFDRFGIIFVSAARSGNSASTVGRREPLALIAEANVAKRYTVDPERVFVGGFSGGSRVALRLALGYPDIFRGVLLNAGSDPIGDPAAPLPRGDLFRLFQDRTRVVYVTGDKDEAARPNDLDSMSAMRRWCVVHLASHETPYAGHKVVDTAELARALADLETPSAPDPGKQTPCQGRVDQEMEKAVSDIEALIAAGKGGEARKRLMALDARFGGLAAPRSVELAGKLGL